MKTIIASTVICLILFPLAEQAQPQTFPYRETFDTARTPLLPAGWSTTTARASSGDFTTSTATPFSAPLAAFATDARVAQCLVSPAISFTGRRGGALEFYERRSSSFTAGLIVEASVSNDPFRWIPLTDTLVLSTSSSYVRRSAKLPPAVDGQSSVLFRWRTLGNGSGSTGTLRIDDVGITVEHTVDLALDAPAAPGTLINSGDDIPCVVTVRNMAAAGAVTFTLSLFDSTLTRHVTDSTLTHFFAGGDSFTVALTYPRIESGIHRLGILLSLAADEDTTNNTAAIALAVRAPAHALIINEIMYDPASGATEYVELCNRTGGAIDMNGWNMTDGSATTKNRVTIPLPRVTCIVRPMTMCIVAADSSVLGFMNAVSQGPAALIVIPSLGLNNSGDDVVLFDPSGATVDSVRYAPGWHLPRIVTQGKSLERINPNLPGTDPRNWSTSVAERGGTPGAPNSIYTSALPSDATLVLSPNPFSPNNDGVEDFLGIMYGLPSTAASLRVRIYDTAGRLIRTLANNEPAAAQGTVMWNGRDDANTRVRMGMYIVFVEALDPRGGVLRAMKGVAVVATKLE